MKEFIFASFGGLGVFFLTTGPYCLLLYILIRELKKEDKK